MTAAPAPVPAATRQHLLRQGLFRVASAVLMARFARCSWSEAQRAGAGLGAWGWRLSRRDRRRALEHLALAYPELDADRRGEIARQVFLHLGRTLGECLWMLHGSCDEVLRHVAVEGWEEVEAARAERRPILVLTGHCGNWELLGATMACRGLPLSGFARQLDDPGLDQLLLGLRARFGTRTIQRGAPGAARELLKTLRGAGGLCMLIDQDTRVDGVWVPFFGRPAFTPVGAAELAQRFGAAVVPTFIERRADGSHLLRLLPRLELPSDPIAATSAMTAAIEQQVRRLPEQWVWFHRRWRRAPPTPSTPIESPP